MPPRKPKPTNAPAPSKRTLKALARPTEEPISETLQSAIFEVDSAYLRTTVLALCKRKYDGPVFNRTLEEWLVTRIANTKAAEEEDKDEDEEEDEEIVEDEDIKEWIAKRMGNNKDAEEKDEDEDDEEINEEENPDEAGSDEEEKPELATCEYCKEEFDLLDNKSKDCLRHTGKHINLSLQLLL